MYGPEYLVIYNPDSGDNRRSQDISAGVARRLGGAEIRQFDEILKHPYQIKGRPTIWIDGDGTNTTGIRINGAINPDIPTLILPGGSQSLVAASLNLSGKNQKMDDFLDRVIPAYQNGKMDIVTVKSGAVTAKDGQTRNFAWTAGAGQPTEGALTFIERNRGPIKNSWLRSKLAGIEYFLKISSAPPFTFDVNGRTKEVYDANVIKTPALAFGPMKFPGVQNLALFVPAEGRRYENMLAFLADVTRNILGRETSGRGIAVHTFSPGEHVVFRFGDDTRPFQVDSETHQPKGNFAVDPQGGNKEYKLLAMRQ